jgi:hypothetical protein
MNTDSYANIPSKNPTPMSKGKSATPISMIDVNRTDPSFLALEMGKQSP